MVTRFVLPDLTTSVGVVPALPPVIGTLDDANSTASKLVSYKYQTISGTSRVKTTYIQEYVDLQGRVLTPGTAARNFVRYCERPGSRLVQKVKFEVNGNPLDEYESIVYAFHEKFCVPPNKLDGWKRLVGQELPKEAYSDLSTVAGTSQFSFADTVDISGSIALGSAVVASNTSRKMTYVLDGPQTPALVQPSLELWVPLLFWLKLIADTNQHRTLSCRD